MSFMSTEYVYKYISPPLSCYQKVQVCWIMLWLHISLRNNEGGRTFSTSPNSTALLKNHLEIEQTQVKSFSLLGGHNLFSKLSKTMLCGSNKYYIYHAQRVLDIGIIFLDHNKSVCCRQLIAKLTTDVWSSLSRRIMCCHVLREPGMFCGITSLSSSPALCSGICKKKKKSK